MKVYLKCPYSEKDEAKALGARWDAERRKWFVKNPQSLEPFAKWLSDVDFVSRTIDMRDKKPPRAKAVFVTVGKLAPEVFPDDQWPPWEYAPDVESIRILRSL